MFNLFIFVSVLLTTSSGAAYHNVNFKTTQFLVYNAVYVDCMLIPS